MIKEYLQSFLKNKNKSIIFVILIIGIMLMLITPPEKKATSENTNIPFSEAELLEKTVAKIKGAGKTSVLVTYYGTGTENIVFDTKIRNGETDKKAVLSDGKAVTQGISYPRVKGVLVVSKGADDFSVKEEIIKAVTTALDIPEYKVAVMVG